MSDQPRCPGCGEDVMIEFDQALGRWQCKVCSKSWPEGAPRPQVGKPSTTIVMLREQLVEREHALRAAHERIEGLQRALERARLENQGLRLARDTALRIASVR